MEAVNSSSIRAKVIGRFDFHHNSRNLQELQIAFPNIWTQMEESLSRQIVAFNGK